MRTVALALLIFVYVGRVQELMPALQSLYLGKVAMLLSLALLLSGSRKRLFLVLSKRQVRCTLGILFLGILSVPASVWPGGSFDFIIGVYSKLLLFFFVILLLVVSFEQFTTMLWCFVFVSASLACCAIFSGGSGRLSASDSYDPNDLALVMVCASGVALGLAWLYKGLKRWILLSCLPLFVLTIYATQSRGGVLGLLMLIFLAAVKKFKSYAKALGVAVVLSSLFFVFMPDDFSGRVGTLVEGGSDYNLVATEGRIAIWKRGLTFMATNPILGIGIGQFGVAEGVSKGRGAWMAAHNSFIQIGAELGAGGLALFCMLIWSAIKSLRNIQKADHPSLAPYATVATYLEVTIWSFCVMASFLSQAYSNLLYMLLASSVVMEILVKKDMDALAAGKGI